MIIFYLQMQILFYLVQHKVSPLKNIIIFTIQYEIYPIKKQLGVVSRVIKRQPRMWANFIRESD